MAGDVEPSMHVSDRGLFLGFIIESLGPGDAFGLALCKLLDGLVVKLNCLVALIGPCLIDGDPFFRTL